jgi:hypothetical protein
MPETKNVAVEVAKEVATQTGSSQTVTTQTGVRVRLTPVSTAIIEEVSSRVLDPEVPMWHNETKDRDEPNPDDPKYIKGMDRANRERGMAVMDAMVMFGLELVDGLPENSDWLKKLKFMEKRGQVDLSSYDLEDPFDLEFLYKRYIAADNEMITKIGQMSTLTPEAVARAEDNFRGNSKRRSD